MVTITFISSVGTSYEVNAEIGESVMNSAVKNSVPGIIGECGGACTCATCHVYVDDAWVAFVSAQGPIELEMLDYASDVRPNSRLSCQIAVRSTLDGLVLHIPETQG
jgi:2Fe-2S ferredoxin